MDNKDTQVKIPVDVVSPYKQPVYTSQELQGKEESKTHEKTESKKEKKSEY
jgi:hypothetical protein